MKYSEERVKLICDLIKKDSYTIPEICALAEISKATFHEWMNEKVDFSDAVKKAREDFDKEILVECNNSLLKLIKGYEVEEKKTVLISDAGGRAKIKEQTTTKKHIPPNLGAIIHFQTNKDPENWKNRQSKDINIKDVPIIDMSKWT